MIYYLKEGLADQEDWEPKMTFLIGILGVIAGVSIAAAGLPAYVVLLPVSGFLVGFFLGAGEMVSLFGGGFLATTLGIFVGLLVGVLFAIASYFFWYAGVLLSAGFFGFVLGAAILGAFGLGPDWLLFVLALALGVVFFIIALVLYYPIFLVIGTTAFAGSAIAIGGVLVLFGQIEPSAIGTGEIWRTIGDNWILWLVWIVGGIVGIGAQLSMLSRVTLPESRWTSVAPQPQ
jgi:hypothetical protein